MVNPISTLPVEATLDDVFDDQEGSDVALKLLSRVRYLNNIAEPLNGPEWTRRRDALAYYDGRLYDVADERARIPDLPGRSRVTDMLLAETVETMLPTIMDIVTDKEVVAVKRRNGEPAEVAKKETDALYSIIYEENEGWQSTYDAIWWAAVGRYGVEVIGYKQEDDGSRCVTSTAVHPDDVYFIPSARGSRLSPYWGIQYRLTPDEFQERFGLDPVGFSPIPLNDELSLDGDATLIENDLNIGVVEHYLKDGKGYLKVTTDYRCNVLLDEPFQFDFNPVIWYTVYRRPHSLLGYSAYDRVQGVQAMNTAVLRLMLDQAQFSQSNRPVVNINQLHKSTLEQLATDAPGVPIFVTGDSNTAIRPLVSAAALPFDPYSMFEYLGAQAEARAGVGRNMQGVNAEALHETATVGAQMENRQQMRIRTIARHIAETAIVAKFEAVHGMARLIGQQIELDGEVIDAAQWQAARGVKAFVDVKGGSEAKARQAQAIDMVVTKLAEAQGGPDGPLVQMDKLLNAGRTILESAGVTDTTPYIPEEPVTPPQPDGPPPPSPEEIEAQAKAQHDQQKLELEAESKTADLMLRKTDQETKADFEKFQLEEELALKRETIREEFALKWWVAEQEIQIKREQMRMGENTGIGDVSTDISNDVELGGDAG